MSNPVKKLRQKMGPRRKYVFDNLKCAQELLELPVTGDLKALAADTRKLLERLDTHFSVYKQLREELEVATYEGANKDEIDLFTKENDEHFQLEVEIDDCISDLKAKLQELQIEIECEQKMKTLTTEDVQKQEKLKLQQELLYVQREQLELERKKFAQNSDSSATSVFRPAKLPKLDFEKFNGDIIKYQEFWDSFDSAVHKNKHLSPVDKMNYLRSKLEGEAKHAISGLTLTNDNYNVAVGILQERYGNKQTIITAHQSQLMKLGRASNSTQSLREVYDNIETHLRSLEALETDVNNTIFVSVILEKLPPPVIMDLANKKGDAEWTAALLRKTLKCYIQTREFAENQSGLSVHESGYASMKHYDHVSSGNTLNILLAFP